MDEQKRMEYEARQKAIRDYNSQMKSAREYGLKKGMEEGIERGVKQGIEQGKAFCRSLSGKRRRRG